MIRRILVALLLAACSPALEGDGIPPAGNLWRITDPTGCAERVALETIAAADCGPERVIVSEVGPACWKWYLGITGPYAVPGVESLTFGCAP
jgi:hypothetical protein